MSHHWCFLKYISVEPPTAMFFFVDSQPAPWKKQLYCPAPWDPEKYAVYNQWIWCLILFSWSVLRRPAARWVEISSSLRKTLDVLNLGQALERVRTPVSFTRCFLVVFFFLQVEQAGLAGKISQVPKESGSFYDGHVAKSVMISLQKTTEVFWRHDTMTMHWITWGLPKPCTSA